MGVRARDRLRNGRLRRRASLPGRATRTRQLLVHAVEDAVPQRERGTSGVRRSLDVSGIRVILDAYAENKIWAECGA